MKRSFYTIGSLVILLVAAFVFVLLPIFAGGSGKENSIPPFGYYNGQSIRYEQGSTFSDNVARYADYFKNQNIEINDSNYYYIFNYAFNATVASLAQKDFVEKSNYIVPESAINRRMRPYFSDENGNYSERLYRLADSSQVSQMMKSIEDDLFASRYTEDCYGSQDKIGKNSLYGLKTSTKEVDFIHNMGSEKRTFDAAVFNMDNFPDSEKILYGNSHSELFAKYDLSIITCEDKTAATSLSARIKNNEVTFFDAVVTNSDKTYSNGEGKLTNSYYYNIKAILKNADDLSKITSLAIDAISEPIETEVGYSIFRCDGPKSDLDTANSDDLKSVYRYITGNEYSVIEDYYTKKADALITALKGNNEGESFANLCEQFEAKCEEIKPCALNYGNLSVIDKLDTNAEGFRGADTNEEVLKTIFSLKNGETSKPITNGSYILVMQLKSIKDNVESITGLANAEKASGESTSPTQSNTSESNTSESKSTVADAESSENTAESGENTAESGEDTSIASESQEDSPSATSKVAEITSEIQNFDSASSQKLLFDSPKLKNNLQEVYYKYIAAKS